MNGYPKAIAAPWKYIGESGTAAYYKGQNAPVAVVLHVMAGYVHTALEWAAAGYSDASWHYTVARNGVVYQHLNHEDGGYQAGITADAPTPTWPLWRGRSVNVNRYSLGVEHEGFPGDPFPVLQAEASRDLCRWLAANLGIPLDHDHFPAHAEIDVVNRVNDFNTPDLRAAYYQYLFEKADDSMTPDEKASFDALAKRVNQLEVQAWGENPKTPRGTTDAPYAESTMFTVDKLLEQRHDVVAASSGEYTIQGTVSLK